MIDVYRKKLASDGLIGLYRAFFSAVTAIVVYRALYFGVYDSLVPWIGSGPPSFPLAWSVTTGVEIASYPLDMICRRMMMPSGTQEYYKGMTNAARQIVTREGIKSLSKGLSVNIMYGVTGALLPTILH